MAAPLRGSWKRKQMARRLLFSSLTSRPRYELFLLFQFTKVVRSVCPTAPKQTRVEFNVSAETHSFLVSVSGEEALIAVMSLVLSAGPIECFRGGSRDTLVVGQGPAVKDFFFFFLKKLHWKIKLCRFQVDNSIRRAFSQTRRTLQWTRWEDSTHTKAPPRPRCSDSTLMFSMFSARQQEGKSEQSLWL